MNKEVEVYLRAQRKPVVLEYAGVFGLPLPGKLLSSCQLPGSSTDLPESLYFMSQKFFWREITNNFRL